MGKLIRLRPRGSGSGGGGGQTGVVDIPLTVQRLKSGSGVTLVSNGIPLRPGDLLPSQLANVRLFVNSGGGGAPVEQAIYIEALSGRHADGTVVSILVQFQHTLTAGTPITGTLRLGELRQTTDIGKTAIGSLASFPVASEHPSMSLSPGQSGHTLHLFGYADGVALPSSPAHLIACNLVMPMRTLAQEQALGGKYATAIDDFLFSYNTKWEWWDNTTHIAPSMGDYAYNQNYYDAAQNCYKHWMRTGDVEWYRRGSSFALNWRELYARGGPHFEQQEGFAVGSYHAQPHGMLLHYWLTGDPESLFALEKLAAINAGLSASDFELGSRDNVFQDPRGVCKTVMIYLCAWRAGITTISRTIFGGNVASFDLVTKMEDAWEKMHGNGTFNDDPMFTTGTGPYQGVWAQPHAASCPDTITNFMIGLCSEVETEWWHWYAQDSRIPGWIALHYSWLFENAWRPRLLALSDPRGGPELSYNYLDDDACPEEGGTDPAFVLNSLYLHGLAFQYQQTGAVADRDQFDAVHQGTENRFGDPDDGNGNEGEGQKQSNQGNRGLFHISLIRFPL